MSRRTFGEKGKGAVKPGNWGYGYTIEYDKSQPKRLSCKVCRYIRDDKSCEMTNAYIPEIGYDMWRHCQYFDLAEDFREGELLEKLHKFYSKPSNLNRYFKGLKKIEEINFQKFKQKRINELKYTGLGEEKEIMQLLKNSPSNREFEENKKRNMKEIEQKFSGFPDIDEQLHSQIEDILKNIVILALENEIDLDDLFSSIDMIYKENKYCEIWLSDRSKKNIDLEYGYSLNLPYYSMLFILKLRKIFKFNIDCIFNMTEEERNHKLINIINNKLKFIYSYLGDIEVFCKVNGEFKYKANRYYNLVIQRIFDEECSCFNFTLNLRTSQQGAFVCLLNEIDLYSEKEDGIMISKYLDAYSFEEEFEQFQIDNEL